MAVRTSSQAGNWSDTATWGGNPAPGDGDRAVIGHAVTIAAATSVTVGTSPPFAPNRTSGEQPTVSNSAGATPTNLATGAYRVRYTNVDSGGKESNVSVAISAVTFTNGVSTPRITLPALPTGVTSRSVYLSDAGGAVGTERLYATGITGTTYEPVSASWGDGTVAFASATPFASASCININAGGTLTVAAGATLVARGDIACNGAPMSMSAGAILELDASASVGTTNTYYRVLLGTDAGTTSLAILTVSGSSESRCAIRSNAGGGNGSFGTIYNSTAGAMTTNSGFGTATYCDFLRLGSSARRAWDIQQFSGTSTITITNCTFNTCGTVYWNYATPNTSNVTLTGNIFTSSSDTTNGNFRILVNAPSTGARVLTDNSFDKLLIFTTTQGATITGNYFGASFSFSSGHATSFSENFLVMNLNSAVPGNVSGNYFFDPMTSGNNVHFISPPGTAIVDWSVTNNIFQHGGHATIGDTGDCISSTPAGANVTITGNIVLFGHSNNCGTGTILTIFTGGTDLGDILIYHNTIFTSLYNLSLNETSVGGNMEAGEVVAKSNLYVKRDSFGTNIEKCHTFGTLAGLPDDFLAAADYNATAGTVATGSDIDNGYHGNFSYSPGANDIALADQAAPGFVDIDRDVAKWGQTFHATDGSNSAAQAILAADPTLIAPMIRWVRRGLIPTNASLHEAAHDGGTIGAVEDGLEISGPSSITENEESTTYTLSKISGLPFDGTEVIGLATTELGSIITVDDTDGTDVTDNDTADVTLTPGNGNQNVYFTITADTVGTENLTCTNDQDWIEPEDTEIEVEEAPVAARRTGTGSMSLAFFEMLIKR